MVNEKARRAEEGGDSIPEGIPEQLPPFTIEDPCRKEDMVQISKNPLTRAHDNPHISIPDVISCSCR
jgi:hypothetical protein